jgi:hypothetical protein
MQDKQLKNIKMNKKFEKVMASTRKASKETVFRGDNAKNNGYGKRTERLCNLTEPSSM